MHRDVHIKQIVILGKNVVTMASISPVQRTIELMKSQGYIGNSVERWVPSPNHPGGGFRKDFLSIIDLIFIKPGEIVGVQVCGTDFAAHERKLLEENENLQAWLNAGGEFILIGWRKVKKYPNKPNSRMRIWAPRVKRFSLGKREKPNNVSET